MVKVMVKVKMDGPIYEAYHSIDMYVFCFVKVKFATKIDQILMR